MQDSYQPISDAHRKSALSAIKKTIGMDFRVGITSCSLIRKPRSIKNQYSWSMIWQILSSIWKNHLNMWGITLPFKSVLLPYWLFSGLCFLIWLTLWLSCLGLLLSDVDSTNTILNTKFAIKVMLVNWSIMVELIWCRLFTKPLTIWISTKNQWQRNLIWSAVMRTWPLSHSQCSFWEAF